MRSFRNSIINPRPYYYQELKLSRGITTTYKGENFYKYGPNNYGNLEIYENIQLFFSSSAVEILTSSDVWCVDGTFSIVPKPYYQLYTISALKGAHVYPVVFAILKDKLESTYRHVFEILENLIGRLQPRVIKSDFEIGSINAMKSFFPYTKISACQFHLGQTLMRKVKELQVYVEYKTQPIIKRFVKLLVCLSYVNPSEVENTFFEIKNLRTFPHILTELYDYFYRVYINNGENARFPISLWNCCEDVDQSVPKTNNAIKGWHSVFQKNVFFCSKFL